MIIEESLIEQREALFQEIQIGSIMEGRVKNITDFGVFVDLGGIDGLLHITDISWGRVNHPSEIIQINEEMTYSSDLHSVLSSLTGKRCSHFNQETEDFFFYKRNSLKQD